jgi:hypothetical protein
MAKLIANRARLVRMRLILGEIDIAGSVIGENRMSAF